MEFAQENSTIPTCLLLTPEQIDKMIEEGKSETVQSALPNYQLCRDVTNEIVEHREEFLSDAAAFFSSDGDPEEWLDAMSGLWAKHFPTTDHIIDTAFETPEIFVTRNDKASSTVGKYGIDAKCQSATNPRNQLGNLFSSSTGIHFDPATCKYPTVRMEKFNHRYIPVKKVNYLIHARSAHYWVSQPAVPKRVLDRHHQHPLKYALRRFASTVISNLTPEMMRNSRYKFYVGSVLEAIEVYRTCRTFVDCIADDVPADVNKDFRFRQDRCLWEKNAKIANPDNPTDSPKVLCLITGYSKYVTMCRTAREVEWTAMIYPVADYLKLLRDNANRAMRFDPPRIMGDLLQLSLYDDKKSVATYSLYTTPDKTDYAILPFNEWYKHHPCFPQDSRGKERFPEDAQAIFWMKIRFVGFSPGQLTATRRPVWDNVTKNYRCLPAPQPIQSDTFYRGYDGIPCLIFLSGRSGTSSVRIVNYVTRDTIYNIERDLPLSAAADSVLLGFATPEHVRVVECLWSSIACLNSIADWQLDLLKFHKFIQYTIYNPVLVDGSIIHEKDTRWWIPSHPKFLAADCKTFSCSALNMGYPYNKSFAIPLAHQSVKAEFNYYMDMPTGKDDHAIFSGLINTDSNAEVKINSF